MRTYPRESVELVALDIAVDGTPITSGVDVAITTGVTRPADWAAATVLDDQVGIMLDGARTPGTYQIWARVTANPETPVLNCGTIQIT